MTSPTSEGTVQYAVGDEAFHTYYKVYGSLSNPTRPPLIVVHGGPGLSHDYLSPLADLALQTDQTILFYDQLGNGKSTRLVGKPIEFFSIKLYVDELANLIDKLGLKEYHLLGHSWGGQLAVELEVQLQPSGLKSLIITNSLAEMKLVQHSLAQRIATLENSDEVARGIQAGFGNPTVFKAALLALHKKYAVRFMKEVPKELRILDLFFGDEETGKGGDMTVAINMGPCRKDWSIISRLHLIRVPILLITGKYDMLQDFCSEPYFWGSQGKTKWVHFAQSSHVPMWEEREEYAKVISSWMNGFS